MDKKPNKYIDASYQLYDVTDGGRTLIEETTADRPFRFVSGMGFLLEAFEEQVAGLAAGETFDFILAPEQAYGRHEEERVLELDREIFFVDGHFDEEHIYPDAIVPLQNEAGNRFNGRVVKLTADKVTIDLNHPLAGRRLNFCGKILESREATNEEVAAFVSSSSGHGEGCCCGGHGGCGHDGEGCGHHEGGCGHHDHEGHGEGHHCRHHGEGECCGKHRHDD